MKGCITCRTTSLTGIMSVLNLRTGTFLFVFICLANRCLCVVKFQRGVPPSIPARPLLPADTIMYLDLDHGDSGNSTGGSISSSRPSLVSTAGSDYKEIDWIKTKALHDTRKDVENKLKGTEN